MDEILQELVEFVKSASPVIWAALYKQVYVDAFSLFMWAVALIVVAVILFRLAKFAVAKKEEEGEYSDWEILYGFAYSFCGLAGISAFGMLVSVAARLINPEFYAIKHILDIIGG